MQTDPQKEIYLREEDVKPPHDADNMYGWAKLMAELTLQAYHREHELRRSFLPLFHGVWSARRGKPRRDRHDRARVRRAESL